MLNINELSRQRVLSKAAPAMGVGSMLMALPPVIILPISYFGLKEKIGWPAIIRTVLAIAGVAILFLA